MSSNESYPQYVVTAVIVAHDGATWLPAVADALADQTRAVQRVVAVDTGSRDRSGAVLAAKFGQSAVFGMDRATGYGAAVARALAHRAANLPVPGASGISAGDRVEWIWLLHDDCEPAPDALEQLLRGAAETNAAAVLGPKLKDWTNREFILEAGITLDTAARRLTGIEPREVDQGQHDGDRDALAVSSAGMLVRRDVWEHVGGFDTGMGLFMEDIDFCWRVHSAGYRVRVITDAVCFHAQAATKSRRAISVGRRARMLDRRNGLLTLLGNLPFEQMAVAVGGNVLVSLLRITFFLLAKRLTAALDEAAAASSVLLHPFRLYSTRRRRSQGRRAAYSRVKADLPPGHSVRRVVEFAAAATSKSQADTTGAHHASADPTEDDSLLTDNGLGRRLLTSPTLMTFIGLLVVALIAGRSLIGGGPLGGGSLVPAWGGASDLWHTYLQAFHPAGIGSSASAPAYLAVLAVLATVLAGKPWLAVLVLLIGCVPLAGMSAMLAVRRITNSAAIRVWVSVTYALLPVAMGVIASGRFGSALVFVLLPLIALTAGRVVTQAGQAANRAAWATGLLVAVGSAFVPLLWLVALAGCAITAVVLRNTRPGLLRNLAVIALTAPVLLVPWTFTLISRPSGLLLEAGLPQPGTPAMGLSGKMLILLSPGGPGLPPYWVTAGLLIAAFAALFAGRRRQLITAGWGVALASLLLAVVISHLVVTPPDGGRVVVWAGLPLALAALGLLLAAAVGAEALPRLLAGGKGLSALASGRGTWVALIAVVACSAPVFAALNWLSSGVSGPVHQVSNQVVPELVAVADGQSRQVRTLVLRSDHGQISYLLLRGASPSLGDPSLTYPPAAGQALTKVVAALTAPGGGLAVDQSQLLADFDIGYILVQAPYQQLSTTLDDVSGLRPYSTTPSYALWQLVSPPARVSVLEPNGTVVPVASGPVAVSGAQVPSAGGTLMLSEPAGGWSASLNGHALTPVPSPAGSWAQAYRLPPGGGTLDIGHPGLGRDLWLLLELLALLVVIGLALPGIGLAEDGQRADAGAISLEDRAASAGAGGRGSRAAVGRGTARRAAGGVAAAGSHAAGGRGGPAADDLDELAEPADASRAASGAGAARRGALAGTASLAVARAQRGGSRSRGKSGRGRPTRERSAVSRDRAGRRDEDSRDRSSRRDPERDLDRAELGPRDLGPRDLGPRDLGSRDLGSRDLGSRERDRHELAGRDGGRRDQDRRDPDSRDLGRVDLDRRDLERRDLDRGDLGRESPRRAAATGPQGKAWPYATDPEQASRDDDYSLARGAGRRSPSGSAPPAQWSAHSADSLVDTDYDHGKDTYEGGGYRSDDYGRRGEDRRREPASRAPWPAAEEPERLGDWTGLRSGRPEIAGPSEREPDRYQPARHGRRGRDNQEPDWNDPGSGRYEPDPYGAGQHTAGRYEHDELDRPGRRGRGYSELDDPPTARWESDRSGQWPGAGGDALEPLPPLAGPPAAGTGRAAAWRPERQDAPAGWDNERDGGDWRESDQAWGDGRGPRRGPERETEHPYESRWQERDDEYEGDTW